MSGGEWLSEEEMPDHNVDGTPMINGVDLNGRPYGRIAEWEDDPWSVETGYTCGPRSCAQAHSRIDAACRECASSSMAIHGPSGVDPGGECKAVSALTWMPGAPCLSKLLAVCAQWLAAIAVPTLRRNPPGRY